MKPNIFIIVIDSFSANQFSGKTKTSITPNLDSLLSQGTYFQQAISVASTTVPSISGIFTGLYPSNCVTKQDNVIQIKPNLPNFLQRLEEFGYQTYAELPEIVSLSGFNNLFKHTKIFDSFATLYDFGDDILNTISELQEPWLYYLHLMDLHGASNIEKDPKLKKFVNSEFGKNKFEQMVSAMDQWLGKITSKLNFENTILIITADHGSPSSEYTDQMENENKISNELRNSSEKSTYKLGHKIVTKFPGFLSPLRKKLSEEYIKQRSNKIQNSAQNRLDKLEGKKISALDQRLFENAIMTTGNLFDEVCKIPLLFVGYNIPKGKKVSKQVKSLDIFPTVEEIITTKSCLNPKFGKSLTPLFKNDTFDEEPILIESINNSDDILSNIGIRTSQYKYFRDSKNSLHNIHLYDLENDPSEELNIAENHKSIIQDMEQSISSIQNRTFNDQTVQKISKKEIDDAKDLLKKLGYI